MKRQMFWNWRCYCVAGLFLITSIKGNASVEERLVVLNSNDSLYQLIEKGNKLSSTKDYDNALDVYNQALKIAVKESKSEDKGLIYERLGYLHYVQKEYATAKNFFHKSLRYDSISMKAGDSYFNLALIFRKEKISDSLLFHLYRSLYVYEGLEDSKAKFDTFYKAGLIFKNRGDYNKALQYLLKAYGGFEEFDDYKGKARICNAIAATQRMLGNLDIAEQYYRASLSNREKSRDSLTLSFAYNNLGNLYKDQKRYDSASVQYNKAIQIQKAIGNIKNLEKYYYNLGTVNYLKGDLTQASKNYQRAVSLKKENGDSSSLSTPYNELARIALDQNQVPLAKKYLDTVLIKLDSIEQQSPTLRYYELVSDYYTALNDTENALHYFKRYTDLYKKQFQKEQIEKIQELQERFESDQKRKKIEDLVAGNTFQKEVISNQESDIRRRDWLLAIALFVIVLSIILFLFIKQRQKSRINKLEVHRLESIFKGQEVVRKKISVDLHDIVATSFDAIRLKILALQKAKNPEEIYDAIIKDVATTNQQIRLISHRISPLGVKIKGSTLTDLMLDEFTEFQFYRKIFVTIKLPLPQEINNLNLSAQTNFYGIVLEALHNVEKHAQATKVDFSHRVTTDRLFFSIKDNGVGFKIKDKKGIGLLNMNQRAELLRGECTIQSSPEGTEINISLPLKENSK